MFWKSNVNKIIFLVPLKYREIITVKPVTVSLKVLKARKEAGPDFLLLCQSRNMVGPFKKVYLHRPIKIINFPAPAKFQKCLP